MNNSEDKNDVVNNNITNSVESTPQNVLEPQVVSVEEVKEVKEEVVSSEKEEFEELKKYEDNKKKGHPVFLVLLILFLFVFVFFLPEITNFVTELKNKRNEDSLLKTGNMICTLDVTSNNLDYNYEITFKYTKNKLKSTSSVITSRLNDNAIDSSVLDQKQKACLVLSDALLTDNIGMNAKCSVNAALQKTIQNIDYTKLNMDYITANIGEFEGFYPEYELDQSVRVIEKELVSKGYKCSKNEY